MCRGAHIKATFNNTLVTITDVNGDVLCWASAGTSGFKWAAARAPRSPHNVLLKRVPSGPRSSA